MEWEKKTKMCQAFNNDDEETALDIVIENLDNMDEQAWDMFFCGVTLIESNIIKNIEKHKKILTKAENLLLKSTKAAFRMALYESLVNKN